MNDYKNPVGSVPPIEITGTDDVYEIRGSGGSLRHRAQLSIDNPYRNQLLLANKNQDKDALYEMAIKWEAQRAQDEWQMEQNRGILEEQRAYDDPSARIARERKAGINPDLAGASSGSSSGGSSSMPYTAPDSPDVQNTTKFSNSYDNTQRVLGTISTVTQVVESIASLVSGFTFLPSQLRISNSQADLAEGTLDSAKSLARSQASSAEISALDERIDFVGRLASFVQPDSDEASVRNLFTSLGVPNDQLDSLYGLYNHYKSSDAMQSEYNERLLRKRDSEARNMSYTLEMLTGLYKNEAEANNLRMQSQFFIEQIQNSINEELAKPENIDIAKDTAKNNLVAERDKSILSVAKIKRDIQAFEQYQNFIKSMLRTSKNYQKSLLNGRHYDDLSTEEQALYNKETLRQWSLYTRGSDDTEEVVDILNSYIKDAYRRAKGNVAELTPNWQMTPSDFIQAYFDDEEEGNILSTAIDTALSLILKKGIK